MRIKICCIQSPDEARAAVRAGAHALGLVAEMPSGPGVLPEERIEEIAALVPPFVTTVLLTSRTAADAIEEQVERCGTGAVQLCAPVEAATLVRLRRRLRGRALLGVVHVNGPEAVEEARSLEPWVDALLLDTGVREGPERQLGGTGRTHDWGISRQISEALEKPVLLAGGLRAENVAEAIRTVRPWAVDVCSGVRRDGRLDPERLARFFAGARSAASGEHGPS